MILVTFKIFSFRLFVKFFLLGVGGGEGCQMAVCEIFSFFVNE